MRLTKVINRVYKIQKYMVNGKVKGGKIIIKSNKLKHHIDEQARVIVYVRNSNSK